MEATGKRVGASEEASYLPWSASYQLALVHLMYGIQDVEQGESLREVALRWWSFLRTTQR